MDTNMPMIPVGPTPHAAMATGANPGEAPGRFDLFQVAQRALRGRYILVGLLALGAAVAGGIIGWRRGQVLYRSEGLVRIAYAIPSGAPEGERRMPTDIFEAFLQSQQALLSSQRMVDSAVRQPEWIQLGLGERPDVVASFAENLKVEHRAGTDFLRISFIDPDPQLAVAAVRSIIGAYEQAYHDQNDRLQKQTLQMLEERRSALSARFDEVRARIRAVAGEIGPAAVDRQFESAVQQLAKLESALTDIQIALVLAQGQKTVSFTVQQIAARDEMMRRYLTERDRLEDQVRQLRLRRLGENHPQIEQARQELEAVKQRIVKYAQDYQNLQATAAAGPAGAAAPGGLVYVGQSVQALQETLDGIAKLHGSARQQMLDLAIQRTQIENYKVDADKIGTQLAEVTRQLQMMQMASSGVAGSLSIISRGEKPILPFQDQRMPMAAMAAMGGAGVPVSLFLLAALVSSRYRYSDETETDLASRTTLLGILPTLSPRGSDTEGALDAAQCVHHIRVMLQVRASGNRQTYLVTSASPGEGKTSLVAALGLSFAASGSRTLLIDGDLVGQRLSDGFNAEAMPGLYEALKSGALNGYPKSTGHKRLWLLPAGQADALDANTMSADMVKRVLEDACRQFDVVLVDSGPVLGSVEASVLAPQVDGVILAVARRQHRPLVERAVRQLDAVGARLSGVVFNRADRADFRRSVYTTSVRSVPNTTALVRASSPDQQSFSLGPLVRSVASFLPRSNGNGRRDQGGA